MDEEAIITNIAERGFCILQSFLTPADLALLRADCHRVVTSSSSLVPSCIYEPVPSSSLSTAEHEDSDIQTSAKAYSDARGNPDVLRLLLGNSDTGKRLMECMRWILGDQVYVLNEQYIVKPGTTGNAANGVNAEQRGRKRKRRSDNDDNNDNNGNNDNNDNDNDEANDDHDNDAKNNGDHQHTAFEWHRDADYLRRAGCTLPVPFVSVWCALDDIHEKNGTLVFAPLDDVNARVVVREKAGTVVLISSEVLHRSSANDDTHDRRVWMPQYSASEQRWPDQKSSAAKDGTLVALGIRVSEWSQ